jgi:predicted metal-binding membrane protein
VPTISDARARHCIEPERAAVPRLFVAVSALLIGVTGGATVAHHASMSALGGTPMAGGWILSPLWTRICGPTWIEAAASFLGMWTVMTVAMMLPALLPSLWRYHEALCRGGAARPAMLATLAGASYFVVWVALGAAIFPLGAATAALLGHSSAIARAAPLMAGLVVTSAGALQFTRWKGRNLSRCRATPEVETAASGRVMQACRYGLRLGLHCNLSCAGLTASLLALGVMDLGSMALVTAAVAVERLAPDAEAYARVIGFGLVGLGLLLTAGSLASL